MYVLGLLLFQFLLHPFALAVFEDFLYWSDLTSKTLNRCDKFECTNQTFISRTFKKPLGLSIAHPITQPDGKPLAIAIV